MMAFYITLCTKIVQNLKIVPVKWYVFPFSFYLPKKISNVALNICKEYFKYSVIILYLYFNVSFKWKHVQV